MTVKRLRILSSFLIGSHYPRKRIRFNVSLSISPKYKKRIRFLSSFTVTELDLTSPVPIIPGSIETIFRSGKGSILDDDLGFIRIEDTGMYLRPGFIYNQYTEYYSFPSDYQSVVLDTGLSITVSKTNVNINNDYPFYIYDSLPTGSIVPTFNPVDSGGYRKITDVSEYTESINGEDDYSFVADSGQYSIVDSGNNYYFTFYDRPDISRTLVYVPYLNEDDETHEVIVAIPDPYEYNEAYKGFLTVSDNKIIVGGPSALSLYIPRKTYTIGSTVPVRLSVRGTNGEICPSYPLLINGNSFTTDINGQVETTIPNTGAVLIKTDPGVALDSSVYHENSEAFIKHFYIGTSRDDRGIR